jgi:hypothetical protein
MVLREIRWEDVDWIYVVQYAVQWRDLVNTVMNLWFPLKAGNLTS